MNADWSVIESKLKRENKRALIHLIQELTAVSPEVQRYLQTRYLKQKKTADQIAPYRQVIQDQFTISKWNNTVSWDFTGVQKAIDDYAKSSRGYEVGLCELLVVALETAVAFADSINLQADDFDIEVTELAERCTQLLTEQSHLYSQYAGRIKKVQRMGNDLGYYALVETLDELTDPFN